MQHRELRVQAHEVVRHTIGRTPVSLSALRYEKVSTQIDRYD
jgi:hypothetical protein